MNVSLSPELEKLVRHKVATGEYESADEVFAEALRLLREQDENGTIGTKKNTFLDHSNSCRAGACLQAMGI